MPTRSRETQVTFLHAFTLAAFNAPQPPGTYLVVVDEEQLEGLSFTVFRRTATTLYAPDISTKSGMQQAYPTTDAELDAALETDMLFEILT